MATERQSRTIDAAPETLWELISDPHHLPRWWPGVTRVEGVSDDHFTEVHISKRGRTVRQDFRISTSEAPRRFVWEQELEGTPFASLLSESRTELSLEPDGAGTKVTVELRQKPRGQARLGGGVMIKRAAKGRINQALDSLAQIAAD